MEAERQPVALKRLLFGFYNFSGRFFGYRVNVRQSSIVLAVQKLSLILTEMSNAPVIYIYIYIIEYVWEHSLLMIYKR